MSEAFAGMMVTPSVKLVRPLGEGGMGAVWVAEHLALRTQVVVKFIASGLKNSKEAHDRFSREAAAASQVKSPHVVQTFDHGITDQGVPYIVMELLEGRDLGQYLEQQDRVPPDLVVELVGQLARALDRAHQKGIIHRDIKPGNVYLCDAGRGDGEVFVKLLDFGIAKGVELSDNDRVDSGTKTGSMIGSPFYMSPEQILGSKDIDHRSDLWSLGVLTFEMLTGRKPFDAETMGGLAIRIHSEPLPLPSVANPALPVSVDAWFARACARDVKERFDSAKVLVEELARALGGEMPKSYDPSARPRLSTDGGRPRSVSPRPVPGDGPTLVAGAATDAGVVSAPPQARSRRNILVMVAILVVVPPLVFAGVTAMKKKETATALVPSEPAPASGGSVGSSGSSGASGGATPGSAAANAAANGAPAIVPPGNGAGATEPATPAGSALAAKGGRNPRPRPGAHSAPASHVVSPDSSSSPLPSPPVTSNPPTPRPAPSGHDIF